MRMTNRFSFSNLPPPPFFRPTYSPYKNRLNENRNLNYDSKNNINHNSYKNFNNNNNHNSNNNNNNNNTNNNNSNNNNTNNNKIIFENTPNYQNRNLKFNNIPSQKKSTTNNNSKNAQNLDFPLDLLRHIPPSIGPISFNYNGLLNQNEPIFDLLGMKLYLDDIIIICILFVLYNQEVKDESLYLILIMLLFS